MDRRWWNDIPKTGALYLTVIQEKVGGLIQSLTGNLSGVERVYADIAALYSHTCDCFIRIEGTVDTMEPRQRC